jgi:hypothetical protein
MPKKEGLCKLQKSVLKKFFVLLCRHFFQSIVCKNNSFAHHALQGSFQLVCARLVAPLRLQMGKWHLVLVHQIDT